MNQAWQGRRFKTPAYKKYEAVVLDLLPPEIYIPEGQVSLYVEFGLSNRQQDIDNGLKPFVDILQKKYEFNDNRIYGLCVHKVIVPKGSEYIKFAFDEYEFDIWDDAMGLDDE